MHSELKVVYYRFLLFYLYHYQAVQGSLINPTGTFLTWPGMLGLNLL